MTTQLAPQKRGWLDVAEVGSVWGIRFVVGLCKLFGRGAARAFLRVLVFYYVLFNVGARRASRRYFARLHARGIPVPDAPDFDGHASFKMVFRHFASFAEVALDRLLIASGERALFEVTSTGREHLEELTRSRRGALLIGAHLGSFEAMRLGAVTQSLPINMVVNFSNAQRLQAVLDQLDPHASARLIAIGGSSIDFVLKIRECIERGEIVAILADRVGPEARAIEVDFLGGRANFAAGPFMLAAALHCPVYLTFGLYRGGVGYDLYCEPFAEAIELPRRGREQALASTVQRFADRLEVYVRRAPYNWFNFYDFWGET
jgi:predicted LPLAT superfamily acyltransferase